MGSWARLKTAKSALRAASLPCLTQLCSSSAWILHVECVMLLMHALLGECAHTLYSGCKSTPCMETQHALGFARAVVCVHTQYRNAHLWCMHSGLILGASFEKADGPPKMSRSWWFQRWCLKLTSDSCSDSLRESILANAWVAKNNPDPKMVAFFWRVISLFFHYHEHQSHARNKLPWSWAMCRRPGGL